MPERGDVPSFGMKSEDEEKAARRSFIKKVAGGAVGAGVVFLAGEQILKHSIKSPAEQEKRYEQEALQKSEVTEDPKEYREGDEIITPVTQVKVKGWRLLYQPLGMAQFAFLGTGSGNEKSYSYRVKDAEGTTQAYISHFRGDEKPMFSQGDKTVKDDFFEFYQVLALPGNKNPRISMDLYLYREEGASLEQELFAGKALPKKTLPSKIFRYKITPKVYTHKEQGDPLRVLAEGQLPARDLKTVHDLHKLMSEYRPLGPVYLISEGKGKDGRPEIAHYQGLEDQTVISDESFTQPKYPNEGEATVVHELTHNLVRNSKLEGEQLKAWQTLEILHKKITKAAGDKDVRKFAAFAIFREGTYESVNNQETNSGHPEDSADELTASAIATFRYYAHQFSERATQLNPADRALVKETTEKIIVFLKSMNSSEQTLKRLIPEIESIQRSL